MKLNNKLRRKLVLLGILGGMIFSSSAMVFGNNINLKDISNHWGKNYIQELINKGSINGYEDNTFRPDNKITNAEFTKILISSLGYKDLGNSSNGHWAYNYIGKAIFMGVLENGEFDTVDSLNTDITRTQMAIMIGRALEENEGLIKESEYEKYKEQLFDITKVPSEYQKYIISCYAKGIITGYEDYTFRGDNTATRAEASTMIIRYLEKTKRVEVTIRNDEEINRIEKEKEDNKSAIKDITEFEKYPINTFLKDSSNYVRLPEYRVGNSLEFAPCKYAYKIKPSDLPIKIDGFVLSKIEPKFEYVGKSKIPCVVVYQTITDSNYGLYLNLADKNFNILRPRNNYTDWTKDSDNTVDKHGNTLAKTYYGVVVLDDNKDWKTYRGNDAYYTIFNSSRSDYVVIVENPFNK